jgi:peptide-methionine (S)-S-oxide reductase
MRKINFIAYFFLLVGSFCSSSIAQTKKVEIKSSPDRAVAIFAEGCFWCSEHVFEDVVGVEEVISGYSGGFTKNPSYQQVGSNSTGHAESVLVYYNPKVVSFKELVNVFFSSQDPTTPNQQGPDIGSSYRSIAFYSNETEKTIIVNKINALNRSKVFTKTIVTEVLPTAPFYAAEGYHQDYVKLHPDNSYVRNVSIPRYNLFRRNYTGKLKSKSKL